MLGDDVEVRTKNILYQSIGDQTHFDTSWHAKMRLTLNESIQKVMHSDLHGDSKHVPKTYQT